MLIRTMAELESEGRVISISHGKSSAVRLLTKSDGVGFSVSEARASAGESSDLWYTNHWEANYIRSGRGVLEDRGTGERWPLAPGVVYCVGPADRHRVTRNAGEGMRIISVFNPPILGEEMVAGGEAPDCGADADAGGIGFASCPALRREHESGFHLAPRTSEHPQSRAARLRGAAGEHTYAPGCEVEIRAVAVGLQLLNFASRHRSTRS